MTSQVAIINRALTKLGATRIVALTDNTKEAREMAATYDIVLDSELRANRWSFSIKRANLAADITAPLFGYSHRFALPSDYLRALMVGDYWPGFDWSDYRTGPDGQDWLIENGFILNNSSGPLRLRYIARITDTSLFDSLFVEVLASRLAVTLCEPITQSNSKIEAKKAEYKDAIWEARRANAFEKVGDELPEDDWLLARY